MDIIKPMLATAAPSLPLDEQDYAFEVKWDGIRAIYYAGDGKNFLLSRNQKDITLQFPELHYLNDFAVNMILDGEIVALNDLGRPSFSLLQKRLGLSSKKSIETASNNVPVVFMIFDILYYKSSLILDWPYWKRRQLLDSLKITGACWQTPATHQGSGRELLQAIHSLGLEGIVAKKLNSPYLPGQRSKDWIKIKLQHRQEFVIGGWVPGKGTRSGRLGALLLGYYSTSTDASQKLHYAGKVGTGFTASTLDFLTETLSELHSPDNPFITNVPDKNVVFIKPTLVAEIEFTEWTPAQTLRHPSFKGLRQDKKASEVTKEL